ncbi:DEAD/DEAH box helicase [Thermocrinis sp.]|jgi:helicase|uniref:DEAD/DEAH box helicase n=1 Tax=Thermocrinis sp. TaxID=2024383 RepID=UPI003C116E8E
MRVIEVLEGSSFSINPLGGKLVYMEGGIFPKKRGLLRREEVDERIPYSLLNPLQTAFEVFYEDGNVVVSAPTSAGKSLLAYLFMRRHEGRAVYCAPTKALVGEKKIELSRYYNSVGMRTGDNLLENLKGTRHDVVVAVYESLAQGFRNRADWVADVSCVVLDEVHHIRSKWVIEEIIAYLKAEGIPVLALSATLPEEEELARYLDASLLIKSRWRPVPLERYYYSLADIVRGRKFEKEAEKVFHAIFKLSSPEEQTIIFVPNKMLGWALLEYAYQNKLGILNETVPFDMEEEEKRLPEIAFHNADIPKEEREAIEKAFREGKIKRLIATQTLAYGVNLPADKVIIFTRPIKKGNRWELLPNEFDILQMEGRAGRLGIKEKGVSCIVAMAGREGMVEDLLNRAKRERFRTALEEELDQDALSLLLLLGIKRHKLNYSKFLKNLYSYKHINKEVVQKVLHFLEIKDYISLGNVLQKGELCVRFGIPPTRFEDFLERLRTNIDKTAIVRPLIMKKLDSLKSFIKKAQPEHSFLVLSRIAGRQFGDNTFWLVFFTQGLTIHYPHIARPPGEFSTLRTEALYVFRTLYELQKLGVISWSFMELLQIAHSIAYGVPMEYAFLAGIKGIGHIYANYLRRALHEKVPKNKLPSLLSPTKELIDVLSGYNDEIKGQLEKELTERYSAKNKKNASQIAKQKVSQVVKLINRQEKGWLIDDHILTLAGFCLSQKLLPKKKAIELLKSQLEIEDIDF